MLLLDAALAKLSPPVTMVASTTVSELDCDSLLPYTIAMSAGESGHRVRQSGVSDVTDWPLSDAATCDELSVFVWFYIFYYPCQI